MLLHERLTLFAQWVWEAWRCGVHVPDYVMDEVRKTPGAYKLPKEVAQQIEVREEPADRT